MKNPFRQRVYLMALLLPGLALAQVMTVNGPIEADKMGLSVIHEHVLVDWIGADSTGYNRWDRNEVVARALPYFRELQELGVETFLDCTPAFLGRDPRVLKALSDQAGINILTNTGYYGSGNNKYVPKSAHSASAEDLAAIWIAEFEQGIDGSGIRPGFLKMSVENRDSLSPLHEKLVRAAALTHRATGLTIVSHTGGDGPARAQLRILQEMGVSPGAFVWTHAQGGTLAGFLEAASRGAWISLDHVNAGSDVADGNIGWYLQTLTALKAAGLLDHVLLSHDAGWYNAGQENGGYFRPYTDLFTHLIPELKANGFTQANLDLLLIENPRRAFALRVRVAE